MDKRTDKRVVKTKSAILEALLALMQEKKIENITMKEIALRAKVDRKTVYNYYSGIHAVQEALEEELARQFEEAMADVTYSLEEPYGLFVGLTKFLEENRDLYSKIARMKNNRQLLDKIVSFLRTKIIETIDSVGVFSAPKKELVANYVAVGMVSVYYEWFVSEEQPPLQEFSKDMHRLVMEGIFSYLTH